MAFIRDGNPLIEALPGKFMIRYLFLSIAVLIPNACKADGNTPCSVEISLDRIYSDYIVFDVVRYGGGLTPESIIMEQIGKKVSIKKDYFNIRDLVIPNPKYEIKCYLPPMEGEVDANRWSDFYGFGIDRQSIDILEVYNPKDANRLSTYMEIVSGEIWELYDGWLFKMKLAQ